MLLTDAAFEFIEHLDAQTDTASLLNCFQTLISKYGFEGYCIGDPSNPHVYRKDRVWGVTWPEGWLKRFADQRYQLVDPLIRHMNVTSEPFRWSEVRPTAGPAALQVLDEAAEFGMKDGFALPIYGAEGAMIGITIAAEHYDLTKRDEAALHMAAIYFHAKFARFRMRTPPTPKVSKLTPRERECLSWVASGKTDWEISQILNISEQTAHEYVQNAISKLNATTRAQAVAVAMLTRQILR
jgi:LuxR family transcriptional regulator, quorum-sensing system regulator BjaR1